MSVRSRSARGRRAGVALVLGGLLWPELAAPLLATSLVSTALAADESPETEALLRRGIQLRREGNDEAALNVFLEAEAHSPSSVRVLLHVATAAQAASKWLIADEYLKKAARHENDPYYQRYRAEIEEVRAATAQRVGLFRAVGEPKGAQVSLNGQPVGTLPMETPKAIEAGTYVLEVTMPGYYRLRRPISVPGAVLTRETVELNARSAAGGDGPDEAGAGAPSGAGVMPEAERGFWQSPWLTWTFVGVGAAGLATTGVALLIRENAAERWNDETRCLDREDLDRPRIDVCGDSRDKIDSAEQLAIIGGVVGLVGLGAAITHWLATSDDSDPNAAARRGGAPAARMTCGPGFLSVSCSGTF